MRTKPKRASRHHSIATKTRCLRVPVTAAMGEQIDNAAARRMITTAQFMREAAMGRIEGGK